MALLWLEGIELYDKEEFERRIKKWWTSERARIADTPEFEILECRAASCIVPKGEYEIIEIEKGIRWELRKKKTN